MIVGICFIVIGSLNINRTNEQSAAIILNDAILVLVFFISVVNVIISAFGIEHSSKPLQKIHWTRTKGNKKNSILVFRWFFVR